MVWFRFDKPFDFVPSAQRMTMVRYQTGVFQVTRECADKAEAGGFGGKTVNPTRPSAKAKPVEDAAKIAAAETEADDADAGRG